jgi:hypothetical protein
MLIMAAVVLIWITEGLIAVEAAQAAARRAKRGGTMITDGAIFFLVVLVTVPTCMFVFAGSIAAVVFGADDDRAFSWQRKVPEQR